MRRVSFSLLIPAALGFVLAGSGDVRANCLHGLLRCGACGGSYGYSVNRPPAPAPQPGPSNPGGGGAPPIPEAAPSLPYPGAALDQPASAAAAYARAPYAYGAASAAPYSYPYGAAPAAPYAYGAAPAAPYSYAYGAAAPAAPYSYPYGAAPAAPYAYGAAPAAPYSYPYGAAAPRGAGSSLLEGYSAAAPIMPVPAWTPLANGQLVGSHIFQVLGRFGKGLSQSGLLDLAVRGFFDVSGVMPTTHERQILENIVARFLQGGDQGGAEPGGQAGNGGNGANGNTRVIRIIVTVEVPPGAEVVDVKTQKQAQPGKEAGADEQAGPMPKIPSMAPAAEPQSPKPSSPGIPALAPKAE
ncbi:MAG: hypothetical protein P4L85_15135 [Paludisphaera borealis]|uniref:hypothetical protein n=1 Tax=Paludisphaera borealis TaxID=1387353 RepID=UPI00283D43FE|nr:hypothetical protein [Paludisphaera borealis]MDR3620684.1 hypothetical protein [Paludisphaera borealis]